MKSPLEKQVLRASRKYPPYGGDGKATSAGKENSVEFNSSGFPVSLKSAHLVTFKFLRSIMMTEEGK